jgi:hypothetical protein
MPHQIIALLRRSMSVERVVYIITVLFLAVGIYSSRKSINLARSQASQPDIGVGQIIRKLRSELGQLEAERLSNGDAALFRIKDVDLELNFVVKVEQSNKNELHFEAVTVGADQQASLERANKITIHMEIEPPTWTTLKPAHLSDQDSTELPYVPLERK